jgi:hypothetical protein
VLVIAGIPEMAATIIEFPSRAEFHRRKNRWLTQLASERDLPAPAFKVAYLLAEHVNHETGDAWPSLPTLAQEAGMSPRWARTLIRDLAVRGYLIVIENRGRSATNRYRLATPDIKAAPKPEVPCRFKEGENRKQRADLKSRTRNCGSDLNGIKTGTVVHKNRKNGVTKTGTLPSAKPLIEPLKNLNAANAASAAAALHDLQPPENSSRKTQTTSSVSQPAPSIPEKGPPEAELFRRSREILGNNAGGLTVKLLKAKSGSIPLARAALETSATKADPREYIGAIIRSRDGDTRTLRERGEAW